MSHQRDFGMSLQDEWSKALLFGLCAGLSLLLLLVASMDRQHDTPLHIATNVYGLQTLAGAGLSLWRVWRRADKPLTTPAVASVWLCVGLGLWAVGQALWTWAAFAALAAPGQTRPVPYTGWSDIFYIASDAVWLVALLKIFQSLRRRGLTEISPFMPIMTTALVLLVGAFAWIDRGLIQNSASDSQNLTKLVCDFLYILVTFAGTILAAALVMGQNAEIPLPVQQCLRWLCAAAAVNAVAILAFTVTEKLEATDSLAYYNGNWVDWLFLIAMYCWGMAALKWPVRQEELEYAIGTTRSGMRESDVYRAAEIAESCCREARSREQADEHECERVAAYVDSLRWVLDNVPSCWRVVKLGDMVIGSTFLFPVPRQLMEAFLADKLKELEMFEKVKETPVAWDCLYLADASILSSHRRRELAFKAFKATIENIAKDHPHVEVDCWPTTLERKRLAEKLQKHLKEQNILLKMKD